MSKHFAMVGNDVVWGLGRTEDEAIRDARRGCPELLADADWDDLVEWRRTAGGTFRVMECSAEFAAAADTTPSRGAA